MTSRISQTAVGVTLYVALVLSIYGLSRLAFPDGGGPFPTWFASLQVLFEAGSSVLPGFTVGWLCRERGFMLGAVTGAIGAIAGNAIQLNLWGLPPLGEQVWRLAIGSISVVLAASATNAIGGVAGVALRNQLLPSNPQLNRTRADNARAG